MSDFFAANPWAAVALGAVVGFLIGVTLGIRYGDPIRAAVANLGKQADGHSLGFPKGAAKLVTGAWLLLVVMVIGNILYGNVQNSRQDEDTAALVDRNTVLTECLSRLAVQITTSTALRSEASERRDESLVGSKKALRELIRLRVLDPNPDPAAERQAAEQYLAQTQRFIEASGQLDEARRLNPPPEFKDFCPKVQGTGVAKAPTAESAQE